MTLQSFYDLYFELTVPLQSVSTVKTKKLFFQNRLLPALGEYEIQDIKFVHVQELVNELLKTLKPKTVKNIISGLSMSI